VWTAVERVAGHARRSIACGRAHLPAKMGRTPGRELRGWRSTDEAVGPEGIHGHRIETTIRLHRKTSPYPVLMPERGRGKLEA
jgi:hypothetical protein